MRYPIMEELLGHAQRHSADDLSTELAKIFNLPGKFGAAPFLRLADGGGHDDGIYFVAEPVYLAPDRDQLVMLPLPLMKVQAEEAQALAETFNCLYATEGYHLEVLQPQRWYLHSPSPINCTTWETSWVAGKSVFEFMPQGEDSLRLRQLMNGIQMLFSDHPVNQRREVAGLPVINSLWLWGGGQLPKPSVAEFDRVLSDMPLITGLAKHVGCACGDPGAILGASWEASRVLLACDCTHKAGLEQMEKKLAPWLLNAVRHGGVSELMIYPGNGRCYKLGSTGWWRFWRRRRLKDVLLCA